MPDAHGGSPFCGARAAVLLKIANEDESMAMIIKEQLKPTPRNANLAIRTLIFIPCSERDALVRILLYNDDCQTY